MQLRSAEAGKELVECSLLMGEKGLGMQIKTDDAGALFVRGFNDVPNGEAHPARSACIHAGDKIASINEASNALQAHSWQLLSKQQILGTQSSSSLNELYL